MTPSAPPLPPGRRRARTTRALLALVAALAAAFAGPAGATDAPATCEAAARAILADLSLFPDTAAVAACRQVGVDQGAGDAARHAAALVLERAEETNAAEAVFAAVAAGGHAGAITGLARMKRQEDPQAAAALIDRAVALGDAGAEAEMGEDLLRGRGRPRDVARARQMLERAAERGAVRAMHRLGWMAANGTGGPRDSAVALAWFRRAAAAGERSAARFLAEQFLAGGLAPADPARAADELERLALTGDTQAGRRLIELAEADVEVRLDPPRLLALLRHLAQVGRVIRPGDDAADDRRRYAAALWHGEGAAPDPMAALALWPRGAGDPGVDELKRMLASQETDDLVAAARALLDGADLPADPQAAEARLRLAAERGDARAMTLLGDRMMLEAPADALGEAVGLYERAAAAGSARARHRLATLAWRGLGVARDPARALTLARAAAEGGDRGALTDLFRMTAEGTGMARDPGAAARYWVALFTKPGELPAGVTRMEEMRRLAQELGAARPDVRRAGLAALRAVGSATLRAARANLVPASRRSPLRGDDLIAAALADIGKGDGAMDARERTGWLELAAETGDPEAAFELARRRARGEGMAKDLALAMKWMEVASTNGHSEASLRLVEFLDERGDDEATAALAADRAIDALHGRYLTIDELVEAARKARPRTRAGIGRRLATLGHPPAGDDAAALERALRQARARLEALDKEARE